MFWGFGHTMLILLPLLLLARFFWLVLLVFLIAFLVRQFGARRWHMPVYNPGVPPYQPSALEILRQRYARGEIDAVTYEQMRERLESASAHRQQ
jgi:putative membrane protein